MLQRPDGLALHSFADGVVVYDESDGSVRALSPTAGLALDICKIAVRITGAELSHQLGLEQPSQEDLDAVTALLRQLESMGFLEHVPA